jgi:hypothetical protein
MRIAMLTRIDCLITWQRLILLLLFVSIFNLRTRVPESLILEG